MLRFLPTGFIGLMVGGLIAANSSTILTHLNWGASYLVHDFYRRFVRQGADERHYVRVGRLVTIGLFVSASAAVYLIDTAKDTFDIILQVGAGTGLLYLVRWFWWRVNAWCEVAAMTSSLGVSVVLLIFAKQGIRLPSDAALLLTVAITTVCWVATAYLGPATDRDVLVAFYRTVKPFGPGWAPIERIAGVSAAERAATNESIPRALLGWVSGCAAIWSALFAIGNGLYGRWPQTVVLVAVFLVSTLTMRHVLTRLWAPAEAAAGRRSAAE